MLQKNRRFKVFLNMLAEAALIFFAYHVSIYIRFTLMDGKLNKVVESLSTEWMIAIYSLCTVVLFFLFHLYIPLHQQRASRELTRLTLANTVAIIILGAVLFLLRLEDFSRIALALFWFCSNAALCAKRILWRLIARRRFREGIGLQHVVLVGSGETACAYWRDIREYPQYGRRVVGYIGRDANMELGPWLGDLDRLGEILAQTPCDEVVVALEPEETDYLQDVLDTVGKEGLRVSLIPFYHKYFPRHPTVETMGSSILLDLRATPLDNLAMAALKRAFDIFGSAFLLLLFSPLMLFTAIVVKLESPGPIFFRQQRVGLNKKEFTMLKFRSMKVNTDSDTAWSSSVDPRRTRFGSFIRRYSIDELPQLFNTLRGDMSLVGPRPELPFYTRQFKESVPLYLVRQQVRPGMTGWAQVHGLRGDTSIEARVKYDIWYIENWTPWLDLRILFLTLLGGFINHEESGQAGGQETAVSGWTKNILQRSGFSRAAQGDTAMDTNKQDNRPRTFKEGLRYFEREHEQIAQYILLFWCLLPILMGVFFVFSGLTGKFPSLEELKAEGSVLGKVYYDYAISSYQTVYFILGAITVCFSLLCLILSRRRVFSRESLRRQPWFYMFGLFLIWAFLCSCLGDFKHQSFVGQGFLRDGFLSYCIYGSVFLCASVVQKENLRRQLIRTFVAVISVLALIIVIQANVHIQLLDYCFPSERAAVFYQFNHFGYMLCMATVSALGLFLYDRQSKSALRALYLADFFFLAYALIVNDTFGAILAVIAALPVTLVFYLRAGRKVKLRVVAIILVLVLLVAIGFVILSPEKKALFRNFRNFKRDIVKIITQAEDAGSAGTNRFGLWKETVKKIKARPIFGYGPEGLDKQNALPGYLLPHNTYLQIAAYTGIPGLLFYLSALFLLVGNRWKKIKTLDSMVLVASGTAFAYLVSAFVGAPVFNTEPYFWLFLGLVTVGCEAETPLLCPTEELTALN